MAGLCQYKNLFGAPGKGAHAYRFMGVAVVDVVLTVLAAVCIAWVAEWPVWYVLGGLFAIGIVLHHLFCVRTTVDKIIFGK